MRLIMAKEPRCSRVEVLPYRLNFEIFPHVSLLTPITIPMLCLFHWYWDGISYHLLFGYDLPNFSFIWQLTGKSGWTLYRVRLARDFARYHISFKFYLPSNNKNKTVLVDESPLTIRSETLTRRTLGGWAGHIRSPP